MDSVSSIMARGSALLHIRDDSSSSSNTTMIDLLIALLALVFIAMLLVGILFMIRRVRRQRAIARQQLPTHNKPSSRPISNHRRLTIQASPYNGSRNSSIYFYDEKDSMINSPSSPMNPDNVPEIRITFPDEHDESGRRKSGRVVVVRVGETGVGLEPLVEEQLPAYQKESNERFHNIDMEQIGGLKEKSEWS